MNFTTKKPFWLALLLATIVSNSTFAVNTKVSKANQESFSKVSPKETANRSNEDIQDEDSNQDDFEDDFEDQMPVLNIFGSIRNDALVSGNQARANFNDILETKINATKKYESWMFTLDARVFVYGGKIRDAKPEAEAKLLRSFIRYFSTWGEFTVGKTYISLGNSGLFNVFDTDKSVYLTDLSYAREGLLAGEYYLPIGEKSGFKLYGGTKYNEATKEETYQGGGSLFSSIKSFDFGLVTSRYKKDDNISGAYLKGDLWVGVQASYGAAYNDQGAYENSEVAIGIDYSFIDSKLVVTLKEYYNENKRYYFNDRFYSFIDITYSLDEFISFGLSTFINNNDRSAYLIPNFYYVLNNALTLSLQVACATGQGGDEFSVDATQFYSALIRLEGKF